jgi:hypothetical protein
MTGYADFSGTGGKQAAKHAKGGTFPGAIRPQEPENLTAPNLK